MSAYPSPRMAGQMVAQTAQLLSQSGILLAEAERQFRKSFIEEVLRSCRGNQSKTALELGVHRNTLLRDIQKLGIEVWQFKSGSYIGPQRPQSEAARMGRIAGGRRGAATTNFASKERAASGGTATARSALAPVSGGPPSVSQGEGGRGETRELPRDVAPEQAKPSRGIYPPEFEVECGGLKA